MYGIYEGGKVIAKFVAPVSVRSNQPVFASDTLSLKRYVSKRPAQRWEIETRLEPLSHSAEDLFVDLISKGYSSPTTVTTPQNYGASRKLTGSNSPTATGAVGASLISVTNTGFIPKGTYIRFSNHSKVYLTLANRDNSGTVSIFPALRAAVSNTTFLCKDDVIMTCFYDLDTIIGMSYVDGILMDLGTIKLVESV
jgi:hypothetical protein